MVDFPVSFCLQLTCATSQEVSRAASGVLGNGKMMTPGSLGRQGWEQPSRKYGWVGCCWPRSRCRHCREGSSALRRSPAWDKSSTCCIYTFKGLLWHSWAPLGESPAAPRHLRTKVHPLVPGVFFSECCLSEAGRSPAVRGWEDREPGDGSLLPGAAHMCGHGAS